MWLKHIGRLGVVYRAPWNLIFASTISAQSGLLTGPVVTRIATADPRFGPPTVQLSNGRVVSNPLATTIRFANANRGDGQVEGPAIASWNARAGRDFRIGRRRLEAALDFFNITNRGAVQSFLEAAEIRPTARIFHGGPMARLSDRPYNRHEVRS